MLDAAVWSHLTAGLAWNASTLTRKAPKRGFPRVSWFRVGVEGGVGFGKSLTVFVGAVLGQLHCHVGECQRWSDYLAGFAVAKVDCGRDFLVHWMPILGWWQGWPKKNLQLPLLTIPSLRKWYQLSTFELQNDTLDFQRDSSDSRYEILQMSSDAGHEDMTFRWP